jgi:hypothetical protein
MTEYRILSAGIERPLKYGRETGESYLALQLRVGKRDKLELLRLTDDEALVLASELITGVRQARSGR